jgi:CubicO group peptidase (beta-lactamase class C family)
MIKYPQPMTASVSRRTLLGATAASGVVATGALAKSAAPAVGDAWNAVEAVGQAAILSQAVPGMQVCVRRGDAVLFSRGFGLSNLETRTATDAKSVFRIGSVTKEFTAALVLSLAEKGRLRLDDPLGRFLPSFPVPALTLGQLLTHTSGLSNYTSTVSAQTYLEQSRQDRSMQEMVEVVAGAEPLVMSEPGAAWAYSNSGYVLLGAVIESIAGSYAQAMADFLRPLGLQNTAVDDGREVIDGRVSGYVAQPEASAKFANAPYAAMSYAGASGAMRATAEELGLWRSALLSGWVVSADSLAFMTTPARLSSGGLPTDDAGSEILYGAGVYLDPMEGRPALRGGGAVQGFVAVCDTVIPTRLTTAILLNVDGNGAPGVRTVMRDLRRAVRDAVAATTG